jgi:transketolase
MSSSFDLVAISSQVRRDILRMVHAVNSGHPGGSLGCVELFVSLYFKHMKIDPQSWNMDGTGEDVFFLSNGHISPVWYSTLSRRGYFPTAELSTFRKLNTRLQGHPTTHEHLPGVRVASGSLGQGLSVGLGAALSKKMNGDHHLVYVLHGDGELQEGQVWEAAIFAAHNKVDNVIAFVDVNGQQIDGPTEKVLSLGNLKDKWTAFGWEVLTTDGNDLDALNTAIEEGKRKSGQGKPVMILMTTAMGKGVDFMEGTHKWHGVAPNDAELANALSQLNETLGDY